MHSMVLWPQKFELKGWNDYGILNLMVKNYLQKNYSVNSKHFKFKKYIFGT